MTDTRSASNACSYAHHAESLLHCETEAAAAVDPWAQFGLTKRETDVARLLLRGFGNKGIALSLTVTVRTVKFYVAAILRKTGTDNRTAAALYLSRIS